MVNKSTPILDELYELRQLYIGKHGNVPKAFSIHISRKHKLSKEVDYSIGMVFKSKGDELFQVLGLDVNYHCSEEKEIRIY